MKNLISISFIRWLLLKIYVFMNEFLLSLCCIVTWSFTYSVKEKGNWDIWKKLDDEVTNENDEVTNKNQNQFPTLF